MDEHSLKGKNSKRNIENRWHRIERKHINSIQHGHYQNGVSNTFCRDILKSKTFFKEHQMKRLMCDDSRRLCLDPNLVMDLRHEKIKRRKSITYTDAPKSPPLQLNGYTATEFSEQENLRQVERLNRELSKYKKSLESLRPKTKRSTSIDSTPQNECERRKSHNENMFTEEMPNLSRGNVNSMNDLCYQLDTSSIESFDKTLPINDSGMTASPAPISENVDLVVKPTMTYSVQESLSVSRPNDAGDNIVMEIMSKEMHTPNRTFDGTLSLDHHMSIFIRRLDLCDANDKFQYDDVEQNNEATEKTAIINALFGQQQRERKILLQKYFMKWVHFNTIEKLTKRNPDHTRLKKMEIFLQNITSERKKTLEKLKAINKAETTHRSTIKSKISTNSSELLARKFNNKLKIQQDIIELQKLKLKRQERVIAEMKLSRLLEDADESQGDIKADLKFVARNGCQKSRSKARCLQITSNLKDEADDTTHDVLEAKGLTAPKFLVEMQARALDRELKHQQALERRQNLEREKDEMRLAAEEAKRLEDEAMKRQRIGELRRKRYEEKQRKIQKEMDRMKFIADLERAKQFERFRMLKWVLGQFRNLIRWKRRNEQCSVEFRRTTLQRKLLLKWKEQVNYVWSERKRCADIHYNRHCVASAFKLWHKYYWVEHGKQLVAADWYDMHISERYFRVWNAVTAERRMVYEIKEKQAEAHYGWHLKWRVLDHWRRLQAILKIEKETEARRERWRHKIYELLPDYTPNRDDYS